MSDLNSSQEPKNGPQAEFVQNLFGGIAGTYDKANDVITFGMARSWRKKLVSLSGVSEGDRVLDCATGTGDLAIEFKKRVGTKGKVIGSDFCREMLDLADPKAKKQSLDIDFEWGDATQLKYTDDSFDICSIAYGIRNVNNVEKALSEMARVTRPGGRVMVLETGENRTPVLSTAIDFYFKHFVPRIGGWVSGDKAAYEYLNQSSGAFPCRENFLELMKATGQFMHCSYTSIMGGASFIYKGIVK